MSVSSQIPVYEQVCVKTEEKLVGYRDLTDNEIEAEELFSSGIPSEFGVSLDDNFTAIPFTPNLPGIVVSNPPGTDYEPPAVPLPAAFWLFAGAIAALSVFQRMRKKH